MSASLLNQVFTSMNEFPDDFHPILMHFLNLLKPKVIVMNLSTLFKLVRKTKQSELGQLISLFGPDVRKELFASISKENPPSASQLNAQSYATLISDGTSEQIAEFVTGIGQQITAAYAQKTIDARKAVALFTIMFEKSEALISALLEFFDSPDAKDLAPLKLELSGGARTR